MNDITYCTNIDCGITSCNRHMFWADKTKPNSFADFIDCPYWGLRQEGEKKTDGRLNQQANVN